MTGTANTQTKPDKRSISRGMLGDAFIIEVAGHPVANSVRAMRVALPHPDRGHRARIVRD